MYDMIFYVHIGPVYSSYLRRRIRLVALENGGACETRQAEKSFDCLQEYESEVLIGTDTFTRQFRGREIAGDRSLGTIYDYRPRVIPRV